MVLTDELELFLDIILRLRFEFWFEIGIFIEFEATDEVNFLLSGSNVFVLVFSIEWRLLEFDILYLRVKSYGNAISVEELQRLNQSCFVGGCRFGSWVKDLNMFLADILR